MGANAAISTAEGRVPFSAAAGWGVGSFSSATMYQATSVFLLAFLVGPVGIEAALAGLLLFAVKMYDAVLDPFVGTLSDHTKSRWGRRRPYILLGGLLSGASFVLLFTLPSVHSHPLMTLWAIGVLVVNTTGYAVLTIPYLAMPAEMTTDPAQRTYIVSFRIAGLALGQVSGAAVAALLIGQGGHSLMAWVVGGVIAALAVVCFILTARAPLIETPPAPAMSPIEKIRAALSNRPFALLLLLKLFNLIGVQFFFALMPFLFVTALGMKFSSIAFFFTFQAAGMFFSQLLWVRVAKLIGKKALYVLGAVVWGVFTAIWAYIDPQGNMTVVAALAVCAGISAGALMLAGQAMLPDAIAVDFEKTGLRREGLFAGVYTTVEKLAGALAAVIIGFCLSAAGFVSGGGGAHGGGGAIVEQSAQAMAAIKLMALAPFGWQLLSAIPLLFYKLSDRPATITAAAEATKT